MRILHTDPMPTVVICCPLDELDRRLAALVAELYTARTTTGAVATGEAQPRCVADPEPLEVTA